MSDKQYKITIISVGPGASDLITLRGQEAINQQDIIIGFQESLDTFASHKETYCPDRMRTGTLEYIEQNPDRKVGVLVSGDAGFFSLAKFIIQKFGRDSVEVIPGVSSVSAGFAQIKNSWQDFRFKSVKQEENDLTELGHDTILLCDRMNTPEKILQDNPDLKDKFDITVMKDISLETEQIFYDPDESFNSSRVLIVLEKKLTDR
ncbi:MAG: precorrin-6y C5,15-methyltransferase (decarboxylating) subunit CbiE [Denitrovibrio sp.]|nr:MAG: precorrin-6y C5,15-methyltransferase (decarboxylating) subunit CbiE [Denitrovibrio sp.]